MPERVTFELEEGRDFDVVRLLASATETDWGWDEARSEALLERILATIEERERRRVAVAGAVMVLGALAMVIGLPVALRYLGHRL